MSKTTYDKSKKYLQTLNNKIEKVTPLIAYADQPVTEQVSTTNNTTSATNNSEYNIPITTSATTNPAPEMLIAQNTCPSCGNTN